MVHIFCTRFNVPSVCKEITFKTTAVFLFSYIKKSFAVLSKRNFSLKMPKPATHTIALKNHRQKLKEKAQKYSPGTITLQVLGTGAKGAPRSLYMFTDQSRYLFNCGEGTQRLAHEHKMKLSKLEHIFVTHSSWDNIGGLPGVSLTIQDVGVPQITIHGPPGTDEVFAATRRFVVLRHLSVKMAECSKDIVFEDSVMKVQYVPLFSPAAKQWMSTPAADRCMSTSPERNSNSESSTDDDDDVDYYAYWKTGSRSNSPLQDKDSVSRKKRRFSSPERRNKKNQLPAGSVSMAYICHLNDRPGTLNLQACVAQGVPPGPLLGRLKAGEDITLPDGRVVLSKNVTSADEPGPVFIVVECPSEEFLDSLLEEEAFNKNQSDSDDTKSMAYLVVHFTPAHIMDNQRYREWMRKFPPSTYHLVLNNSNDCLGSIAVHRIQHRLNLLSSQIFPLLNSSDTGDHSQVKELNGAEGLKNVFPIVKGYTFNTISLRPQRVLECSPKLVVEPDQYRQEAMAVDGFGEALRMLQAQLLTLKDNSSTRRFPQVVFLGTGSCIPNKTRNTSGILLHLSESSCVVLDCGEGTYGQIVRLYGESRSDQILKNLRAIYISHLHADHHIGLIGLLKARFRLFNPSSLPTLYLLAPQQIRTWLKTYHHHFEPILQSLQLIPNGEMLFEDCTLESSTKSLLLDYLGLSQVRTCAVKHCPNAFGVCITHSDGWKITYSGDTMPCDDLIRLGKGSDLLIHEATMEDDLEEEAKLKMHSTTSQAIHVGRQMEAQFILLTHFSQRYAHVPIFNDSFTSDVGIAFDNMQVCLDDLQKLPLMYPALKLMFAEHYEEMELKALKRQLQKERELARSSL